MTSVPATAPGGDLPGRIRDRIRRATREIFWDRDRYGVLFLLLLLDYVILSLSNSSRWAGLVRSLPVALTALFAVHTSHAHRRMLRTAQVAVAVCLVVGLVQGLTGDTAFRSLSFLAVGVVLLITPVVIARRVFEQRRVDLETVFAALCLYVLIGLIFSQLYVFIANVDTATPFLAQTAHPTLSDFVYLSFVTLTTVGFGDVTARTDLGRSFVVLEALIGQIFLVTLVARMVAMYGSELPARRPRRHADDIAYRTEDPDGSPGDGVGLFGPGGGGGPTR